VASHRSERFPIDRRRLLKTSVAITTANLVSVLADARGNSGGQSGSVGKLGSGGCTYFRGWDRATVTVTANALTVAVTVPVLFLAGGLLAVS